MANKKKKRKNKPRIILLFAMIALLISFCVVYVKQELVLNSQEKQILQMQQQNAVLEEEYQAKLKEVESQNTIEFINNYMRSHFGMVQEGQIRVDITEDLG